MRSPPVVTNSENWRDEAACRTLPTDMFFPIEHKGVTTLQKEAKAVCATCPVQSECLVWALSSGDTMHHGIYGGLSVKQRRKFRDLIGLTKDDYPEELTRIHWLDRKTNERFFKGAVA